MAENEWVMEKMQDHHHTVKDEITELIDACRKMGARLENLLKKVEI